MSSVGTPPGRQTAGVTSRFPISNSSFGLRVSSTSVYVLLCTTHEPTLARLQNDASPALRVDGRHRLEEAVSPTDFGAPHQHQQRPPVYDRSPQTVTRSSRRLSSGNLKNDRCGTPRDHRTRHSARMGDRV